MDNMNEKMNKKPSKINAHKKLIITVAIIAIVTIAINLTFALLPYDFNNIDISKNEINGPSEDVITFLDTMESETLIYVLDADGSDKKYENYLNDLDKRSDKITLKWVKSDDKELTEIKKTLELDGSDSLPYFLIAKGSERVDYLAHATQSYYVLSNAEMCQYLYNVSKVIENMPASYQFLQFGIVYPDVYMALNTEIQKLYTQAVNSNDATADTFLSILNAFYSAPKLFCGDRNICGLVEYVNEKTPVLTPYFLTGHGENEFFSTTLGQFLQYGAKTNGIQEYKPLDISKGAQIPVDAGSIFIFDPVNDISKAEADMLIDYLDNGGSISIITSTEDLSLNNLMSVLDHVGLSSDGGNLGEYVPVEKEDSSEESEDEEADATEEAEDIEETEETEEIRVDGVVIALPNTDHEALVYLKSMPDVIPLIKNANNIKLDNDKNDKYTLMPMFETSKNAFINDSNDRISAIVAASAQDKTNGGKLMWFTGAESFKGIADEMDEESAKELMNVCGGMLGTLIWVDYQYESKVPNIANKIFEDPLMSVDESNYVFFPIVIGVVVVALLVAGAIIIYKRKKA